jgi:hypothetical protein
LNPCHCKSVRGCKCRILPVSDSPATQQAGNGLATLARAAAICCRQSGHSTAHPRVPAPTHTADNQVAKSSSTSRPGSHSADRNKATRLSQVQVDLPPIMTSPSIEHPMPPFPTMPPLSTIKSLAGSGCTCGLQCQCPGCVQHRTPEQASKEHKDCADGCGSCIDHAGGIELPTSAAVESHPSGGSSTASIIDQFFARAAALPLPPLHRKMGVQLDPTDVLIYPTAAARETTGPGLRLVNLPKLECCSGRCRCPVGQCGCEKLCEGACADHGNGDSAREGHRDLG